MKEILNTNVARRQDGPDYNIDTAINGQEALDKIIQAPN